ncbi:ARM repeat superfamily protein [Quillaja saponaria]|uniref:ARM repeat superfamily protein n=1 Tax=Quillaja saponaria TaxID=32244 RepID=A0AAD7VJI3_QUISA|nr:ARM repeat superfamily protein [Quillaja saponaria]
MGFISRKVFPACGNMCVCCPALRSSSRQPVKRYKKLLAEIFPKSHDSPPCERKIVKLCAYAAKNHFRIPKIAKYLEERCHKELRAEHIQPIIVVTETYNKLLCICKDQIAYFAVSLLNVINELLENSKQDALQTLGCQTLTRFIFSQADGTYTHNIEKLVQKVCMLAQECGEEHQKRCLRASSLQCLSAMVWFMAEFSRIFVNFDELVHVTLDNYELVTHNEEADGTRELHHNWVDEVVRCEARGGAVAGIDTGSSWFIIRPQPEKKDPSLLTREEIERPEVWAQICIQRMAELTKESATMRCVLDPMFVYFDSGRHWVSQQGLAMMVLSNMCYFLESLGKQQLILSSLIRHLDHKNVLHDPQLKTCIIRVATSLVRQIRSGKVLAEIGFVCDLCRHLRKSLQSTTESVGEQEFNLNILLQNSIEDCLLEIARGIGYAQPLFDMMAITLENLPSGVVARATIGSMMILARIISLAFVSSSSQQVFPEALLVRLLKVMLHPDIEARIGAHRIFSVLLIPFSGHPAYEVSSLRSGCQYQHKKWSSHTASASDSITALLEKLRRCQDGTKTENQGNNVDDGCKQKDIAGDDCKQNCGMKSSPNFYNLSSIIGRTAGNTSLADSELCVMKLTEDQVAHLLSSFWIQANLPDNLPSNFEALAHSFILTLVSLRLKNPNESIVVRFFQLPLSLWSTSLDPNNRMLAPSCQRSIFVLSAGMLMFACKIFRILDLNSVFKSLAPSEVDPYLGISDDNQVYVKSHMDIKEYGTAADNQLAMSILFELQNKIYECDNTTKDILVHNLASITELEADDLAMQLSETFAPDEAFMFGPRSMLDLDHTQTILHSNESLSFDGDFPSNSLIEDDVISEASVAELSRFITKMPSSPSMSNVISIGQLLESALEVAGQVAGTSVSTSPLPYNTMASQCEALGTGGRKKLSNWLAYENLQSQVAVKSFLAFPDDGNSALEKIINGGGHAEVAALQKNQLLAMRLPPASPFDNFLRAAGC